MSYIFFTKARALEAQQEPKADNILKAIGFSARRKRMRRGSVHLVHDRWRASLQQRRKLKCEEYSIILSIFFAQGVDDA
jgi:hypothetical protein